MRAWIVAIAVVMACKSGKDAGKGGEVVQNAASAATPTPTVAVATVLAKDEGKPPFLLLVDGAGTARLAAAKTWADLDAGKLQITKKATKLAVLDRFVREDYAMGRDPLEAVTSWNDMGDVDIDLSALDDTTKHGSADRDDPPPPPEEESGGTGTAMALDEGKMGKKDSDRAEGQYKMKKDQDDPQLARQQAIEQARTAGILGNTALVQGGAFASLTGTGDISSGFDDTNIYGCLLGNEAGEMNGGFGFGRSGFGPGGGGTGWGTIGTGRYGTIGHGSGTGSGYGVGGGRGGMRGRTSAVPTVSIGQPNAQGDLDKAIIRRYIKRNIQKITYCYEKQLLAKPGLSGTVSTQFFISPNGNVTASNGSGVDPEVSSCVADVIRGIEFPKPKGGGGVQVNYPFTFRPAGQ